MEATAGRRFAAGAVHVYTAIGSVLALSGVVSAMAVKAGLPVVPAMCAGVLAGAA